MTPASDFPFDDIVAKANEIISHGDFFVLQKFSCQHCGQRLTIDVPNVFYTFGNCDKCGKRTDIKKRGCNYMMVSDNPMMRQILQKVKGAA